MKIVNTTKDKSLSELLRTLPSYNMESYDYLTLKNAQDVTIVRPIHSTESIVTINGVAMYDSWHFNVMVNGKMAHVYVTPMVYPDNRGNPVLGWQIDGYRQATM